MICVTISQTIAPILTAEADAPMFDHGEMEDKPMPVPNASRISHNAAAANAPATTAGQDTPEEGASFLTEVSANPGSRETAIGETAECAMFLLPSDQQLAIQDGILNTETQCVCPIRNIFNLGHGVATADVDGGNPASQEISDP